MKQNSYKLQKIGWENIYNLQEIKKYKHKITDRLLTSYKTFSFWCNKILMSNKINMHIDLLHTIFLI
jgi:hypothetical protein